MQHVLRAISGPQAGAVYVLGERTILGRASDCDIQILHEGVSRHHARVTCEDDGRLWLVDLSSDNGTFVESERVARHELVPGDVFRIMRTRFAYEVLHGADAITSMVFRRKVTSGDSLRQTAAHARAGLTPTTGLPTTGTPTHPVALRESSMQGLPGSPVGVGERDHSHSRPQAAAPARSGARPGAASAPRRSMGAETRARTHQYPALDRDAAAETSTARRPTPTAAPRGERDGRPGLAVRAAEVASRSGSYRFHAEAGEGRRERITAVPTTLVQAASGMGSTAARVERASAPAPTGSPAGRMAPVAPAAREPTPAERPATSGPRSASVGGVPVGGGWVRVPRPPTTPGSMRPGSTLAGVPKIADADPRPMRAPSLGSSARPETPPAVRKGITAEYGAVGGRRAVARTVAAPEPEPDAAPEPDANAAPEPEANAAPEPDAELDAMTTLPKVRRKADAWSSATPTEEVPRVTDEAAVRAAGPEPAAPEPDEEHDTQTRPRVTISPRALAYEDTLRFQRAEASPSPSSPRDAPRGPTHATSAEIVSALEALLPGGELDPPHEPESDPAAERPDAARLEPGLVDILEYRELRLRTLQGRDAPASAAERCAALGKALQQQPPPLGDDMAALRRYHRFACSIPARLTPRADRAAAPVPVEIEDISAGGAKITCGEHTLRAGDPVVLTVELTDADRARLPHPEARTVAIEARVVWAQPYDAALGLVFAGMPSYDHEPAVEPPPA